MPRRYDSADAKRRILTACVRFFLEKGYTRTTVAEIVEEADVSISTFQNVFRTKDGVLVELVKFMFGSQFDMAGQIAGQKLPPVYVYAVETSIQLALTELNENLREIYIEAYSLPETSEYIYLHTTAELKQIFSANFPDYSDSDFYEMEIGTAGLMRSYMARKCDIHFPLERKLSRFLTAAMRVYRVPEEKQAELYDMIRNQRPLGKCLVRFLKENGLLFAGTDRNVLNLPAIGKSMTFHTIGLTSEGKRILKFDHDGSRRHSPIIDQMGEVYIVENKSVAAYLRQLKEIGEDVNEYRTIWNYCEGETEPRFSIYEYPAYPFKATDRMTNLEL